MSDSVILTDQIPNTESSICDNQTKIRYPVVHTDFSNEDVELLSKLDINSDIVDSIQSLPADSITDKTTASQNFNIECNGILNPDAKGNSHKLLSMTHRDQKWIERIQLLQTAVHDSLDDDYYFYMHTIKHTGCPPTVVRVVPSDNRRYESKLSTDGPTLGRLNLSSSSHPPKLISLETMEHVEQKIDPYKRAMLKIEEIYIWLLDAQTERQRNLYHCPAYTPSSNKMLDTRVPLKLFLSSDLSRILSVGRGRRLIIHLLPIVSDFVSYLFHILSALVQTNYDLDKDTYNALNMNMTYLPVNQLIVLMNIIAQSKNTALNPLMKTRFGITLLLKLSLLCAEHLWPILAAFASSAATQFNSSIQSSAISMINFHHPEIMILQQLLQRVCQLLQAVEIQSLQIPFEPLPHLTVTFQRVFVALAAAYHHQPVAGVISSGILAKLEYLENISLSEHNMNVSIRSRRQWTQTTETASYRPPWPSIQNEKRR